MTIKVLLFVTLLSLTAAYPRLDEGEKRALRRTNEINVGASFLATLNNFTYTTTTSSYVSAEAEEMGPLAAGLTALCEEQGDVESQYQTLDGEGQLTTYSLSCPVPKAQFDSFLDGVRTLISEAQAQITSDSVSISSDFYSSGRMAQQKGLEMLLEWAETIEQVMLNRS